MRRRTFSPLISLALAFASVVGVLVADDRPAVAVAPGGVTGSAAPMQADAATSIVSLVPARVFESRAAVTVDGRFANVGRVGAGQVVEVPLLGRGGVPVFWCWCGGGECDGGESVGGGVCDGVSVWGAS